MGWAPGARRRHVEFTGIGLGVGDELGNRLGWNRWVHDHDVRRAYDASDWSDVAEEIVIELAFEERCIDRARRGGQQERVTIRGRTHDHFGPDRGGRAWPVLDDEWLAKALRQPLPDEARGDVGRAARRRNVRHFDIGLSLEHFAAKVRG